MLALSGPSYDSRQPGRHSLRGTQFLNASRTFSVCEKGGGDREVEEWADRRSENREGKKV